MDLSGRLRAFKRECRIIPGSQKTSEGLKDIPGGLRSVSGNLRGRVGKCHGNAKWVIVIFTALSKKCSHGISVGFQGSLWGFMGFLGSFRRILGFRNCGWLDGV